MNTSPTPVPPSSRPAIHVEVAARSDPGLARDGNEDSFLVARQAAGVRRGPARGSPGWVALAVCDGMGGAAAGEVASRTAIEVIDEVMRAGGAASADAVGRRLSASVEDASRRVFAESRAHRGFAGMGTTATACALAGDALFVAQVGDSRAYLLRGGELTRLTRDQTLAQMLLERGQLAPEEVDDFEHGHVILQAVGTHERVEVDLRRVRVCRGDVLLVCSDGLHGPVREAAIREVLASASSPEAASEALIARALAAGGPDNVTVIVARLDGEGLAPPAEPVSVEQACLPVEEPDPTVTVEEEPAPASLVVEGEPAAEAPGRSGAVAWLRGLFRR